MGIYADQLTLIRAAKITLLSGAQAVTYKGRTVTMINFAQLTAEEERLTQLAAQEAKLASGGSRLGVTYVTPV